MSAHFHNLKVKNIKKETADCVSIAFDIPENIAPEFKYKEGQNITIRKIINGQDVRRSYSICAAPFEGELRVAIKKVDCGLFSQFANDELKVGDALEVLSPVGNFTSKITENDKNFLAIAAGSGITPVISIIKHTLAAIPESNFTLIYGNRSRNSIIFFEELEGLKNKYINRFNLINILSREQTDNSLQYGRITPEKLNDLKHITDFSKIDRVYICGPERMIFSSNEYLQGIGIPKDRIHFELFTIPGETVSQIITPEVIDKGDLNQADITVKVDGRSFNFKLARDGSSILDAALALDIDLPYACKGGVCCSCRAQITKGSVEMDSNFALDDEEVEAGFVLTCQSHPTSDKVVVDFDVK